ncbi:hypothetical protein PRMUPPPA20_04680 [Xylanibacter ruminicola]|uniref:Type I restriction-modification system, S subunit n=2 Tax=Xylanibacter ruminicola TaxID=839 RepID=D5EYU5_XYLR2|nr:restriction endonuclease subunit S [Xylanibacter ruminicola]ADE82422.1 type I restriction-modification system, S subunit [Xylanibacter ruminicola 23]GJG32359.1 hypothetical protein PRMUPPPA20_04680 [Xylanibacter ruminicola]SEH81171.1 type I restriction enzyme, S subunit [Xylanibacter ruminicola]
MDRSKWEYKKLGEVAKFVGGGTPSKANEDYYTGNIPWATVRDMVNFNLSKTELCITDQAVKESATNIIPKDTIIISTHVGLGKICLLMQDTAINQDLKGVILPQSVDKMFFAAWYKSIADYVISNGKGATVKGVTMKFVNDLKIPIPPINDQQRIVAELDCLNEMIALKQEQLKEFDKLAQSIFYNMFGDPVTNEKEWDVIELGDKCEVTSFKRVLIEDVVDSGVPFIRGTELMALSKATKGEKIEFTLFITPEHYEQVKAISGVPAVGDLLIPSINSEGNIWILDTDEPRYYKDGRVLWVHVNHDAYTSEALKFIMHILLKKTYSVMATGATFAELKLFVLRELKTILPPLALQQQFAEKIQAIEAQKELVKKSIAETQQLLDSRMDYYFD